MNNYIYENNNDINNMTIKKFSYKCSASDAVWTGSSKGSGVITYNRATGLVSFNKLYGTNPYWWQFAAAAICTVPPEDYILKRDRRRPFKTTIKEGYSGALHVHLDEYYFCKPLQKYIKDGGGFTMDVSMGEKIADGISVKFSDLIEITYRLCEWFDMPFSRNPRWWKRGSKDLWRFERLRDFEVVDEVDYDPNLK